MKKIVGGFICVLILSMTIFCIKSQEFFVKIENLKKAKPVSETVKTTQKESGKTVRIVLKANNYTSIYHSEINLTSNNLKVYYGKNYENKKSCKKINIEKNDKLFKNSKVIKVESSHMINWKKNDEDGGTVSYEGMFFIYNTTSGLVVVNQLDLEAYVASVISSEIGEDSPEEALKAQAVCARTFITDSNPEEYKEYKANGDDSTAYQVYNKTTTGEKCRKAAVETKNKIMTYKGKCITAYYFSTSCGYTTDYKIWGRKKQKYLAGCSTLKKESGIDITKEDNFKRFIMSTPKSYESECPFYRWNVYVTNEQVQNSISSTAGINVGEISKIEVNSRGCGGIASGVTVYGEKGQIIMNNQNQIRKALCSYYGEINLNDGSIRTKMEMLPSAFIYIENVYDSGKVCGFKIYGGGFGHGSGMSQNGAREMAKKGMKYKKILKLFYNDIVIEDC
ncbi:MAG: SpoIID/LytB domain-containing protein [Eubacterium sp.]